MATEIERLVVRLKVKMGQYEASMRRAQQQTNQALNRMESYMGSFQRNAERSSQGVGFAAGTLGGGGYLGAAGVSHWRLPSKSNVTLKSAGDITNLASDRAAGQ